MIQAPLFFLNVVDRVQVAMPLARPQPTIVAETDLKNLETHLLESEYS